MAESTRIAESRHCEFTSTQNGEIEGSSGAEIRRIPGQPRPNGCMEKVKEHKHENGNSIRSSSPISLGKRRHQRQMQWFLRWWRFVYTTFVYLICVHSCWNFGQKSIRFMNLQQKQQQNQNQKIIYNSYKSTNRLETEGEPVTPALQRQNQEDEDESRNYSQRQQQFRNLQQQQQDERTSWNTGTENRKTIKVLFVITSVAEYESGRRGTTAGYDRFHSTLLPVLRQATRTMMMRNVPNRDKDINDNEKEKDEPRQPSFLVDVYFISHYELSPLHRQELRAAIPVTMGLQIWDDATPLGYSIEHSTRYIMNITRALARQHRYVIKDKLLHYDVFCNFEDDMLVTAEHVQEFVDLTDALYQLRLQAPELLLDHVYRISEMRELFHGPMTVMQLSRLIPGFIRVEATLPRWAPADPQSVIPILPVDYEWNDKDSTATTTTSSSHPPMVDPSVCCHVDPDICNEHIPQHPSLDDLYYWETGIEALGVRRMPDYKPNFNNGNTSSSSSSNSSSIRGYRNLGWMLLQAGNMEDFYQDTEYIIGDYWSGRDGYFHKKERPNRVKGRYLNNQGGWMGTRRQIYEWHTRRCRGGFLPPYQPGVYPFDGLDARSVEYWSGGVHLVGPLGCNLQRIIPVDPVLFSKHLLYHASNNKQRQLNVQERSTFASIKQFWGMVNTVKKNAERRMEKELEGLVE